MKRPITSMLAALSCSLLLSLGACSSSSKDKLPFKPATLISFEEANLGLAGPSAAGENLYPDYVPTAQFPAFTQEENHPHVSYGVDKVGDTYDFSKGGIVRSNYNSYSTLSPEALEDPSWYAQENQLAVYRSVGAEKGAGKTGDYFLVTKGADAKLYFKEPQMVLSFFVANASAVIGRAYQQHVETEKTIVGRLYVRGYWGEDVVLDSSITLFTLHKKMNEDELRQLQNWKRVELAYTEESLQKIDRLEFNVDYSNQAGDVFEGIPEMVCLDHIQFKTE